MSDELVAQIERNFVVGRDGDECEKAVLIAMAMLANDDGRVTLDGQEWEVNTQPQSLNREQRRAAMKRRWA